MSNPIEQKKITTHTLLEMKRAHEPISMITAYDFSMAKIVDAAGIDVILVGDSASGGRPSFWLLSGQFEGGIELCNQNHERNGCACCKIGRWT